MEVNGATDFSVMEGAIERHAVPALDVEHLTVELDGQIILHDLSFSVEAGTSVAVIGPNGSGKTVLFRSLIGALPHSGIVRWAPGTRIGYVPQKLDIERNLPITGRDLLDARARLTGASRDDVRSAESRVGLAPDVPDRLVGALSGGQFQRLLMAFALLASPTVLLLDEPLTGIDEPGQGRLNESVQRLQRDGVTVLMISHDLSVVYRFATHVLCVTRDHRCFGAPRGVLTPEILSEVYGEPVGFFRHDEPGR
jgi:zinc transport system ATP-binding protein